jgi:hypothetical protein
MLYAGSSYLNVEMWKFNCAEFKSSGVFQCGTIIVHLKILQCAELEPRACTVLECEEMVSKRNKRSEIHTSGVKKC